MIATATAKSYQQDPAKVLGRVERGETVILEKDGQPCAVIIPHPRKTSGTELARRLHPLKPAPEAADAVEALIQGMDDASRRSFDTTLIEHTL